MGEVDVPETDTVTAFRRGDQQAFTRVFDDVFNRLYVFCIKLVRDEGEAEDIAIQAFSKLFERYAQFTSMPAIMSFLYKTARNACFNHLKKVSRLDKRQQQFISLVQADPATDNAQHYMELMEALYKALGKLPDTSRQVLEMIYLEGKKYAEVATVLQISEDAVGNRRHYAIKKLRELLADNPALLIWALEVVFAAHH